MTGWAERALCAETDPDIFYPELGESIRPALRVCAACEVRAECLAYAITHNERFGVWGGVPERPRQRMMREAA